MKNTSTQSSETTVGTYLASRLKDIGLQHYFAVPGDYNLVLLDELLKQTDLKMIGCCNELNAGYAADGYARATGGAAAIVVTYSVGGLSLINAIAGAYAEDLPLIVISGGPNTNSEADYELLHHTLGEVDYNYQKEIYERVTADAVILRHPALAPGQIDCAIATALTKRKPVYIEIACNIAGETTTKPITRNFTTLPQSDPHALKAAVKHAAEFLNAAKRPVLVAGAKLRAASAAPAFKQLADASDYAIASMPNAKSFISEQHKNYMGIYWGPVSTIGCSEVVEASDAALFAGPLFTDYTTTGHQTGLNRQHMIVATPTSVQMPDAVYTNVMMHDFFEQLAAKLKTNNEGVVAFNRVREEKPVLAPGKADTPMTTRQLFSRIQKLLDKDSSLLVETGDSWFNGMDIKLPDETRFEIQMQYGSIGWSVGATLGYALGTDRGRVITCVGDGSFQLTAQEVSTMIRCKLDPIIFLINNGGYTIEAEIHDGPYNIIKNWDYAALVDVFNAEDGNGWGCRVTTEGQLDKAINHARHHRGVCLIEVIVSREDCNRKLLRWGNRVAGNNSRPPHL